MPSLGVDPSEYWGESAGTVADHAQRRIGAIEATFKRRVQAAKNDYTRKTDSMDAAGLAAYLAAVAPPPPSEPFDSAPATCPACGEQGLLSGTPEPDWEANWDVGDGEPYAAGAYVSTIELQASAFECRACGLTLGAPFLGLADFEEIALTEDDFDVSEATAFFQRQLAEDDWDY